MSQPIHIKEQSSSFWKISAYMFMIAALIVFVIYWNNTDAFWTGIFRFISFIFFTGGVLSILKITGGHRTVSLHEEDGQIIAAYRKKDDIILKESHNLDDIKRIYYQPQTGYQGLAGGGHFFVEYEKPIPDACMFQFAGQCLAFDKTYYELLTPFFEEFNIPLINTWGRQDKVSSG